MRTSPMPGLCTRCLWSEVAHDPNDSAFQHTCREPFSPEWEPWLHFPEVDQPGGPWEPEDPARSIFYLGIPDGRWTRVFGLMMREGDLELVELRIQPTDSQGAYLVEPPGWSLDGDEVPMGGLRGRNARVRFQEVWDLLPVVLDRYRERLGEERFAELTDPRGLPRSRPTDPDPMAEGDLELAQIARTYADLVASGVRRGIYPAMKKEHPHYSLRTLPGKVATARKRGLLTSAPGKGNAGGKLTSKAKQILAQMDSHEEPPDG